MLSFFSQLQSHEIWIMVIGALVCSSCGLIGCFLILRKLALMGDAISHAVLPGIVLAVMMTGSLSSWAVFIGAGIIGVLTPFLIDTLQRSGRVQEDASIGAVFTVLFAIGVIMVTSIPHVHIDVECVLYGEIVWTPYDRLIIGGSDFGPQAFWVTGTIFLLNLAFVTFFYKELKVCSFDSQLAAAMGFRPKLMHYLLMAVVSITTISSFESVGAIIVVGMFIAPGAAAYLLTDNLATMLALSVVGGILCSVGGYGLAILLGGGVSVSGSMATVAGILFVLSLFFSPKYGLVFRFLRRSRLRSRLQKEHFYIDIYRITEGENTWVPILDLQKINQRKKTFDLIQEMMLAGMLEKEEESVRLSEKGFLHAQKLIRAHRLWESYMHKLGLPEDHLHRSADDVEHFISPQLCQEMAKDLDYPRQDPHGKPIPLIEEKG